MKNAGFYGVLIAGRVFLGLCLIELRKLYYVPRNVIQFIRSGSDSLFLFKPSIFWFKISDPEDELKILRVLYNADKQI